MRSLRRVCDLVDFQPGMPQCRVQARARDWFKTAVVAEVVRALTHRGQEPRLHFWRTSAGSEVDLLVEEADRSIPIEAKSSATPRVQMAGSLAAFRRDLGARAAGGLVIHAGSLTLPLGPDAVAVPFDRL